MPHTVFIRNPLLDLWVSNYTPKPPKKKSFSRVGLAASHRNAGLSEPARKNHKMPNVLEIFFQRKSGR